MSRWYRPPWRWLLPPALAGLVTLILLGLQRMAQWQQPPAWLDALIVLGIPLLALVALLAALGAGWRPRRWSNAQADAAMDGCGPQLLTTAGTILLLNLSHHRLLALSPLLVLLVWWIWNSLWLRLAEREEQRWRRLDGSPS